jgi:nucleoside-diphosphate-sugar epimerase
LRRVLITGASGFVGSNIARRLLAEGHEVHALLRRERITWRLADLERDLRLHLGDLADEAAVAATVSSVRPDWIFHLAVHGAYSSQTDLKRMVMTNFVGTVNLLEACLRNGFEAFVGAGSSSEYGLKNHAPSEDEPLAPNSHYAVTKAAATLYCQHTGQARGLSVTTLRLYSVYGGYEDPKRLIPALVIAGLSRQLPPLADPEVARDFVYIDDVVDAFLLAASTRHGPGAVYNVGTGVQTHLREVVDVVRRVFDIEAAPEWGSMPNRSWDTNVWVANPRRIQDELGWSPRHNFEYGFQAFVHWIRNNPELLDLYRAAIKGAPGT